MQVFKTLHFPYVRFILFVVSYKGAIFYECTTCRFYY